MGNDQSNLKGLHIESNPIETTDYWTLFTGELTNGDRTQSLSIFKDEQIVKGQLWTTQSPLERATKNLMIFRHPSILKYISSWERGSHKFLATEKCRPLQSDLTNQSDVQICLGLRSILCSLIFLLEQANARHLNICLQSIYVTSDGAWKLAGFEHLWKSKEINGSLLERCQPFRHKGSFDPSELKSNGTNGIEQYAFGALSEEILKNISTEMPHATDFKTFCANHLKHSNPALRPKLSAVLLHPFFNHEFIKIHSFLTELPLKNQTEKQQFFTGLIDRLRDFAEENVASQLAGLLLSRMVLLDATAQLCVTPYLLRPRTDEIFPALFCSQTFVAHIVPRIMQIFAVRDTQIRMILLEYLNYYVHFIPADDLKEQLLPQLLLGIKDTNDVLVAATLRALADLVGILGSSIVIGRNRGRLFSDGRPHGLPETATHWIEHRSITPVMNSGSELIAGSDSPILDHVDISGSYNNTLQMNHLMAERPSPDGGEDVHTSSGVMEFEDDDGGWSDWEADAIVNNQHQTNHHHHHLEQQQQQQHQQQEHHNHIDTIELKSSSSSSLIIPELSTELATPTTTATTMANIKNESKSIKSLNSKNLSESNSSIIKDVKDIEIKTTNAKVKSAQSDEIDFFKDMEPIIQKASVLLIENEITNNGNDSNDSNDNTNQSQQQQQKVTIESIPIVVSSNRFEFKHNDVDDVDELDATTAWDDDTNEWEND